MMATLFRATLVLVALSGVINANQLSREVICRTEVSDYTLSCIHGERVVINSYETQHTPRSDATQLCDVISGQNEQVLTNSQPGAGLQSDCVQRQGDVSVCLLQSSALQRYFSPVAIADQGWNPIPKRILIKYSCQANSAGSLAVKISAIIGLACVSLGLTM